MLFPVGVVVVTINPVVVSVTGTKYIIILSLSIKHKDKTEWFSNRRDDYHKETVGNSGGTRYCCLSLCSGTCL